MFPDTLSPIVKIYRRHRRMRSSSASQKDYRLVSLVVKTLREMFVTKTQHCILSSYVPHKTSIEILDDVPLARYE